MTKRNIFRLLLLALTALVLSVNVKASDKILFYYGGYLGFVGNIHTSDFQSIPGCVSCGTSFSSGNGNGLAAGLLIEYPFDNRFSLGLRLGTSTLSGRLVESAKIGNVALYDDKSKVFYVADANVNHVVDAKLPYIGFEPYIDWLLVDKVHFNVGLKGAILLSPTYDQYEELTNPQSFVFENGKKRRNEYINKDLTDANSFQMFGVFGVSYDLKIGKDMYLAPEVQYYTPFTNIASVDWKVSQFQLGAKLKLPVYQADKIILQDTLFQRDTVTIREKGVLAESVSLLSHNRNFETFESHGATVERTTFVEHYERKVYTSFALSTDLAVYGIEKSGVRQANPQVVIEEIETEETFPILPYVFFAEGQSDLKKARQTLIAKDEIAKFNENSLQHNSLLIYKNMLNVLGSRLRNSPKSEITITGCNRDNGVEKDDLALSEARANAVKRYLSEVWNISDSRIKVAKRGLPAKPANVTVADGIEENGRVEITSSDYSIVSPVVLKEIIRQSNPPTIEIVPTVNSEAGVKSYACEVSQSGKELRRYKGDKNPDNIIWNIEENPVPALETPVEIKFTAVDKSDKSSTSTKELSIKQKTIKTKRATIEGDFKVERFSLILFDFNQAVILPAHEKILSDIKAKISDNSKVSITGYADKTGTPEYNRDLAQRRCDEVQKVLKIADENLTLKAVGSDELIFDNSVPEGRNYCRTVKIEIRTPIKN